MMSKGMHLVGALIVSLITGANAAFGVSTKGNGFTVDTNAGLTFDVSK